MLDDMQFVFLSVQWLLEKFSCYLQAVTSIQRPNEMGQYWICYSNVLNICTPVSLAITSSALCHILLCKNFVMFSFHVTCMTSRAGYLQRPHSESPSRLAYGMTTQDLGLYRTTDYGILFYAGPPRLVDSAWLAELANSWKTFNTPLVSHAFSGTNDQSERTNTE